MTIILPDEILDDFEECRRRERRKKAPMAVELIIRQLEIEKKKWANEP
jgi:hypothetical protein